MNSTTLGDSGRQLVVVVTTTDWDEPPRIRHQVTQLLVEDFDVLFVELPFCSTMSKEKGIRKISDRLTVLSLGGLPRNLLRLRARSRLFHELIGRAAGVQLRNWLRRLAPHSQPILLLFQYDFPQIADSYPWARKVYLCNDDFTDRAITERRRSRLEEYEQRVCAGVDECLAVSEYLVSKLRRHHRNVHLLLPGHSFDVDLSRGFVHKRKRRELDVGYMGFINDRLRFEWFHELASRQGFRLHMIGPVRCVDERLTEMQSVIFSGSLVGIELQTYLLDMQVLVMPYVEREATATQAPNKLFQYLATGKPVVTSPMPNLLPLPPGFVYTASSAADFPDVVRQAFSDDTEELRLQRLAYAETTSWASKKDFLRARLTPACGK